MKRIKEFFTRQGPYYEVLWNISYILAGIWAFYKWVESLFLTAHEGNFWGFILIFILQSLIMGFNSIIGGIILFLILFVLTFLPFLIIKKVFIEIKRTKKTININKTNNQIQEAECFWTCNYCSKEFETKEEANEHEKICQSKQIETDKKEIIYCAECGSKSSLDSSYCTNCGYKL